MSSTKKQYDEIWIEKDIEKLKFSKSIAVLYPNEYKVASSNLGFHSIIKNLCHFGSKPVRFFYDKSLDNFISFDSDKRLSQFDNIFISISFENDLENLLSGFKRNFNNISSISNRIVIGGSAVTLSPFLFMDIAKELAIGDSEGYFNNIDQFDKLNFIENIEIKKHFNSINFNDSNYFLNFTEREKLNKSLNEFKLNYNRTVELKVPVSSNFISKFSSFKNYFLIEMSRGCPFKCKFCTLKSLRENARLFEIGEIINKLSKAYKFTKNFGLISAFLPPLKFLKEIKANFTDSIFHLSSFRLDSIDEDILKFISETRMKTITIAPETGDDSIRNFIGKGFSNTNIVNFITDAVKQGINKIKLYFILGLKAMGPDIDDSQKEQALIYEADKMIGLIENIYKRTYEKTKKTPLIFISINPIIPRPSVDMWNYSFIDSGSYSRLKKYVRTKIYNLERFGKLITLDFISYNEAKKEYLYSWNINNFDF